MLNLFVCVSLGLLVVRCGSTRVQQSQLAVSWEASGPLIISPTDIAIYPQGSWALVADPGLPGIVILDLNTGATVWSQRIRSTGDTWLAPERISYSHRLNRVAVFDAVSQTVHVLDSALNELSSIELPRIMVGVKDVLPLSDTTVIVAGGSVSDSFPPAGVWQFAVRRTAVEVAQSDDSTAYSAAMLADQIVSGGALSELGSSAIIATATQGDILKIDGQDIQPVARGAGSTFSLDDVVPPSGQGPVRVWWSFPRVLEVVPLSEDRFVELHSAPDEGRVRLYQLAQGDDPSLLGEWQASVRSAAALDTDDYVVVLDGGAGSRRTVARIRLLYPDTGRAGN